MSGFDPERYEEACAVYAGADRVLDETALKQCYDRMAIEISDQLADRDPVIMCVMLGGLQPTAEITKRLAFPFEFDYLHATRYRGDTDGGELVWKHRPDPPLEQGVVPARRILAPGLLRKGDGPLAQAFENEVVELSALCQVEGRGQPVALKPGARADSDHAHAVAFPVLVERLK